MDKCIKDQEARAKAKQKDSGKSKNRWKECDAGLKCDRLCCHVHQAKDKTPRAKKETPSTAIERDMKEQDQGAKDAAKAVKADKTEQWKTVKKQKIRHVSNPSATPMKGHKSKASTLPASVAPFCSKPTVETKEVSPAAAVQPVNTRDLPVNKPYFSTNRYSVLPTVGEEDDSPTKTPFGGAGQQNPLPATDATPPTTPITPDAAAPTKPNKNKNKNETKEHAAKPETKKSTPEPTAPAEEEEWESPPLEHKTTPSTIYQAKEEEFAQAQALLSQRDTHAARDFARSQMPVKMVHLKYREEEFEPLEPEYAGKTVSGPRRLSELDARTHEARHTPDDPCKEEVGIPEEPLGVLLEPDPGEPERLAVAKGLLLKSPGGDSENRAPNHTHLTPTDVNHIINFLSRDSVILEKKVFSQTNSDLTPEDLYSRIKNVLTNVAGKVFYRGTHVAVRANSHTAEVADELQEFEPSMFKRVTINTGGRWRFDPQLRLTQRQKKVVMSVIHSMKYDTVQKRLVHMKCYNEVRVECRYTGMTVFDASGVYRPDSYALCAQLVSDWIRLDPKYGPFLGYVETLRQSTIHFLHNQMVFNKFTARIAQPRSSASVQPVFLTTGPHRNTLRGGSRSASGRMLRPPLSHTSTTTAIARARRTS
jgi:hypothetical protein